MSRFSFGSIVLPYIDMYAQQQHTENFVRASHRCCSDYSVNYGYDCETNKRTGEAVGTKVKVNVTLFAQ